MTSTRVNTATADWTAGSPLYGEDSIYQGRELVHLKILSDRRAEGGGIAYLARFTPPEGKVIKIVAVARSDEHVFNLEGGPGTKAGRPLRHPGDYTLNPKGQPHSAFIAAESTSLVVYAGEPDEIRSIEVVDLEPST